MNHKVRVLKIDDFSRSGNPTVHVQNLLLLLPSIRQADSIVRWFWHKVRRDGKIKMKKLLAEMLEAQLKPTSTNKDEAVRTRS